VRTLEVFTARPRKLRLYASIVAAVVVAAFVLAAVFLKDSNTGVHFSTSDQVAMVGIGVAIAAALLWPAWARVRADTNGVEVRNLLGTRRFAWSEVRGVSFPDKAWWARLEIPGDEYVPMIAIQALDGGRAVAAMRELRRLHRESGVLD
jgi:Bacterial PH domain